MRHRVLAVALVACCLTAASGRADERDQLKFIIDDINVARSLIAQQKVPAVTRMPLVIATLTSLIDGNRLSEAGTAAAVFYRGEARRLINDVHHAKHEPIDAVLTWDALADYDRVIARGADIPDRFVIVSETEYTAGGVAYLLAGAKDRAYTYWSKCAALEQAGCMNTVANSKLSGDGHQTIDIAGALELHTKVVATGTRYGCAGAFSAMSVARIVELTGVKRPDDDAVAWIEKAHQLSDDMVARFHNPNICSGPLIAIDEFLVRLGHHERRDDLLRIVLGRPIDSMETSVVRFLLGEIDENAARGEVLLASLSAVECEPHLHLLWFSELNGRHESDRADLAYLRDHEACALDYAFAKRFKSEN